MDAQETSIYTIVLITSMVLGTIILYFFISIRRYQRKSLELHRLNILAEITTLEKERARIAADLHDELGPLLSAVKMKINSFDLIDAEDKRQVEKTNHHIDVLLQRMREISFDLMPNTLMRKGLVIAIHELISTLNHTNDLLITFEALDDLKLSEQKALHLYRIVQEIIYNTLKHAKATKLHLSLKEENNKLLLVTVDDGIGFDYKEESKTTGGLGLRNLLSRTKIIGGDMFLESKRGGGTVYTFEIPACV